MIIYGTRGVTRTREQGAFYCPQCGPDQSYKAKRARRFFTLYFIPLIPLDKLGDYVECQACQGTFNPEILDYDPNQEAAQTQALYVTAMKQVMIATLLADGVVDDDEVTLLQEIMLALGGIDVTIQDLREEIDEFSKRRIDPEKLLSELSGTLNDKGKEQVLKAAYRIAAADGHVDKSELQEIHNFGEAMNMSSAHINGVLTEAKTPA